MKTFLTERIIQKAIDLILLFIKIDNIRLGTKKKAAFAFLAILFLFLFIFSVLNF